jgi:PRC-barrel domain protein
MACCYIASIRNHAGLCFLSWARDELVARYKRERAMAAPMTGSHELRETHDLIGSDKVEGTNVYRSNGEKLGEIERIMLEKRSGKVAYAVMSFGGFLGLGHDHYPVPWARLTYNENLGGYEVNVSDEELKGAPKYSETEWQWNQEQGRRVYDYYKVPPYWI